MMPTSLTIAGGYQELLEQLFQRNEDGSISLGTARSKDRTLGKMRLADWTEFDDYIMEGFVTYSLRTRDADPGLIIEVKLNGTNIDRYVIPSIKSYIRWAGLESFEQDM